MCNMLNGCLVGWSADDAAYLNKRLLGLSIIVGDEISAGKVQLLGCVFYNVGQLRNEPRQFDRLADFVLSYTEKFR